METQRAMRKTALKKAPRISARTQPKVNWSVETFWDALTAQRPITREMMSLSMWKASAMRASEWARKPVTSSSRKKAVSIAIMTLILVLLDQAIFSRIPMAKDDEGAKVGAECTEAIKDGWRRRGWRGIDGFVRGRRRG